MRKRRLDLTVLERNPKGDLRLGSLKNGLIEGLAYRYTIILPLFSEKTGEEVFSIDQDVPTLIKLLGKRFGGCTVSPIFRGTWLPDRKRSPDGDRNMHIYVFAKQDDSGGTDHFFEHLKSKLKRFGRQEEVVVERAEVRLLPSRPRL